MLCQLTHRLDSQTVSPKRGRFDEFESTEVWTFHIPLFGSGEWACSG